MRKILLLEDEEVLNKGITLKLKKQGYEVFSCSTIKEGKQLFLDNKIDLIICDVTLEDGNGVSFCTEIRKISDVHFIFLTAMDSEMDIVLGYEAGADDYITKPFSLIVLISKVNAIVKRMGKESNSSIHSGHVTLMKTEMKVTVDGEEKSFTKTELKLLILFMENSKQILSKRVILEKLFDLEGEFVSENTVAVNIRRLREKIEEDPSNPEYIKNIRGIGYIWDKECY